jgi:5'-nucleotidase
VERKVRETEPWVLVTNDDGADSPALAPLLGALSTVVEVRAVVPASECSWTSKIVSRFAQLEVDEIEIGGFNIWTVTGYPADCVNIGIHSLFDSRPALVVSGINIGTNAGLAYMLSSGTVGAAIEGMLCNLPAVAFSLQLKPEDFARWRRDRAPGAIQGLWGGPAMVTREIVEELLDNGLPQGASLLTVNMPPDTMQGTSRCLTGVTSTRYGAIFSRNEDSGRFQHSFSGLLPGPEDSRGDIAALDRGEVAITPLRFALDVESTPADRRRFERGR